jgi:3-hydroxyacyl-CoA dehydrogenase
MSLNKPVRRIAIIRTGVVGASWPAEFLARGLDVIATDVHGKLDLVKTPDC